MVPFNENYGDVVDGIAVTVHKIGLQSILGITVTVHKIRLQSVLATQRRAA
jgi:hypothetical protein